MRYFTQLEKGEWKSTNVTYWGHTGPAPNKMAYCVALWGSMFDVMSTKRYWGPGPSGGTLKLLSFGEAYRDWYDFSVGKLGFGADYLVHKQPGSPQTWGDHIEESYTTCAVKPDPLALDMKAEFYVEPNLTWSETSKQTAKDKYGLCWQDLDLATFEQSEFNGYAFLFAVNILHRHLSYPLHLRAAPSYPFVQSINSISSSLGTTPPGYSVRVVWCRETAEPSVL
jgi:hypothetical protein